VPRHALTGLTARAENDGVRLGFYLTTPVFEARRDKASPPAIRIYRKSVPQFTWGKHYAEHFDGMDPEEATLIFDGLIEPINNRKFEYVDEAVTVGKTYAYWVSCSPGRLPTGPLAVRLRDRRIWWPQHDVSARLAAIARAHPDLATLKRYGTTVGGRAIPGLVAGNRRNCIALVGTVHAGESGAELMIPALERLLAEDPALLAGAGVAILPNVNIDERERLVRGCPWYLRTNSRGVDINRNFDAGWDRVEYGYGLISSDPDAATYRGPKPESEPETRAVVSFLKAVKPEAVFSYHALASITGAQFLAPRDAKDDADYINRCNALVEPFVAAFYPGKRWRAGTQFATSAGSLPAYAYRTLGVPAFDLEWDGNPDAVPSHTDKTTLKLLEKYQQRHYHGLAAVLRS
jgi:Zinc carboxypeptidase